MTTPVPEPTLGVTAYRTFMASEVTELDTIEHGKVRCVIVTPERAVLDAIADMVILPLYDGELGVQAGRAPFVGQLGSGELRLRTGDAVARFFVDGGFAQVSRNVVNVLTPKAMPAAEVTADKAQAARAEAEVTADKAQAARAEAEAITATDAVTRASRARALARARGLEKVAARAATA